MENECKWEKYLFIFFSRSNCHFFFFIIMSVSMFIYKNRSQTHTRWLNFVWLPEKKQRWFFPILLTFSFLFFFFDELNIIEFKFFFITITMNESLLSLLFVVVVVVGHAFAHTSIVWTIEFISCKYLHTFGVCVYVCVWVTLFRNNSQSMTFDF